MIPLSFQVAFLFLGCPLDPPVVQEAAFPADFRLGSRYPEWNAGHKGRKVCHSVFKYFWSIMPASSIDEVLSQLTDIISESQKTNNRAGYFASLYYKVTAGVKEGIAKGVFVDGPRMERFDVIFANRYLVALDSWKNKQSLSGSWKIALDATGKSSLLVLQHLLLGINAHINLDLGIAAVETMQGLPIENIQKDFDAINAIISSLTYEVIHEISRVSPLLSLMGLNANQKDSILIQFSIGNARDGAWAFAEDLSKKIGEDRLTCIATRDGDISKLAAALANTNGFIRFTVWIIHLFEWKKPGRIIQVLDSFSRTFIKASSVK